MVKRFLGRVRQMSAPARMVLGLSLRLSCTLLLGAVVLLMVSGGFSTATYELHSFSEAMVDCAAMIALVAVVVSALFEERFAQ